jgi:acetamidase/formamidase
MHHRFTPTRYHNTLGSHEPALRIAPGDTVSTSTVDAIGQDAAGNVVAERSNPQTGPFYVEGAEPGDTLAVALEHIWPNRDWGWAGSALFTNTVDPDYVRELPSHDERARWQIDRASGTATLIEPRNKSLGGFTLKMNPMLGCFGVAPMRRQAISAFTSGAYGGNMDYNGFTAGATAYFPVFAPGALFSLGDGHAAQGDGEILGTGIEISMDVRFTVRLLKGKLSHWPRGENADFIFALGNARPLDQALQHATTEMLRWLQQDNALDARGAGLLLGQFVKYEVGNVIDPAYTMVCKLPKSVLTRTT